MLQILINSENAGGILNKLNLKKKTIYFFKNTFCVFPFVVCLCVAPVVEISFFVVGIGLVSINGLGSRCRWICCWRSSSHQRPLWLVRASLCGGSLWRAAESRRVRWNCRLHCCPPTSHQLILYQVAETAFVGLNRDPADLFTCWFNTPTPHPLWAWKPGLLVVLCTSGCGSRENLLLVWDWDSNMTVMWVLLLASRRREAFLLLRSWSRQPPNSLSKDLTSGSSVASLSAASRSRWSWEARRSGKSVQHWSPVCSRSSLQPCTSARPTRKVSTSVCEALNTLVCLTFW